MLTLHGDPKQSTSNTEALVQPAANLLDTEAPHPPWLLFLGELALYANANYLLANMGNNWKSMFQG